MQSVGNPLARSKTFEMLTNDSNTISLNLSNVKTSLEHFDSFSKMTSLILKNQNVADWTVSDVSNWLKANHSLDKLTEVFTKNDIDGYSLLCLTLNEMKENLRILDLATR